ncbi:MAG: YceI family protein [Actinobacteria bacterium]|nr:YceI family protein [Actinomycetota bacterium]
MSATEQITTVPAGTWQHDPVHSSISFAVQHNTVMTFSGQFGEWEARLEDGRLTGSADVSSVRVEDENLVGHLQTPDFFDAEQHPKLQFASTSIERDGDRITIAGDLTIKGTTKEVALTGTVSDPVTDGYGNERVGLDVQTVIGRHDFGVSWNADLPAGGSILADDVTVTARLALTQQ